MGGARSGIVGNGGALGTVEHCRVASGQAQFLSARDIAHLPGEGKLAGVWLATSSSLSYLMLSYLPCALHQGVQMFFLVHCRPRGFH